MSIDGVYWLGERSPELEGERKRKRTRCGWAKRNIQGLPRF
jgi:hypothetical protein